MFRTLLMAHRLSVPVVLTTHQQPGVLAVLSCCGRYRVNNFTTSNRTPLFSKDNESDKTTTNDGSKGEDKKPSTNENVKDTTKCAGDDTTNKQKKDGGDDGNKSDEEEAIGRRPIHPAKVRHGFIPEEWFTAFYDRTGVTGPYAFGIGLLNYLFSKEIYVCEHEYYSGLSMAIVAIVAVKKLGPALAKYLDNEIEKIEKYWKKARKDEIQVYQDLIDGERNEQMQAQSSLLLLELKRHNIDLQIEAANRKELMKVYEEVKHRLDYFVTCGNVAHRMNHKNMVLWIHKEVLKSLPYKDEETLKKCKADLSALALRAKL